MKMEKINIKTCLKKKKIRKENFKGINGGYKFMLEDQKEKLKQYQWDYHNLKIITKWNITVA